MKLQASAIGAAVWQDKAWTINTLDTFSFAYYKSVPLRPELELEL